MVISHLVRAQSLDLKGQCDLVIIETEPSSCGHRAGWA
jgi:hypothetical protein